MINSISGTITQKSAHTVYIETHGIEWEILTTQPSLADFPSIGSNCRIYVHLHHKEDQMALYGFSTLNERNMFLDLFSVNGIGPKQALKILTGITADELSKALAAEDIDRLSSFPGIGKKSAQKIIFSLKDKIVHTTGPEGQIDTLQQDIIKALADMGFEKNKAEKAVTELLKSKKLDETSVEEKEQELLKEAIIYLSS